MGHASLLSLRGSASAICCVLFVRDVSVKNWLFGVSTVAMEVTLKITISGSKWNKKSTVLTAADTLASPSTDLIT